MYIYIHVLHMYININITCTMSIIGECTSEMDVLLQRFFKLLGRQIPRQASNMSR